MTYTAAPRKFFSSRLNRRGPPWKTCVGKHVSSKVTKLAKMQNLELWSSSIIQLFTWVGFSCINKSFAIVQSATNPHKGDRRNDQSATDLHVLMLTSKLLIQHQSNTRRTTRHIAIFQPRSRVPLSWPWDRGQLDYPHWTLARLNTAGKKSFRRDQEINRDMLQSPWSNRTWTT